MNKTYQDSTCTVFETETHIFGIIKDNSPKPFYTVTARPKSGKGKTLATRCTYEKALEIIKGQA